MYTTAQDAPGTYTWERSMGYCSGLDAYGHKDWRVPTRAELNVLFDHQASLGGFDINGSFFPAGSYWSSTLSQRRDDVAWLHNFQDGHEAWYRKEFAVHLRCVR